jgi:hypothetical protein
VVDLSEDTVREVFELWVNVGAPEWASRVDRRRGGDPNLVGQYVDGETELRWIAFLAGYRETRTVSKVVEAAVASVVSKLPEVTISGPPVPADLQAAVRSTFNLPDGLGVISAIGLAGEISIKVGAIEEDSDG